MTLAEEVLEACAAAGLKVVTAESCTGGMVGAALTAVPGSSKVVLGGVVAYSNGLKRGLLGVEAATLAQFGAVSEETAREMALGVLARTGATLAVSITGIAGPGGSGDKPEGRVCFGLAGARIETWTETRDFGALGRQNVRDASRDRALELLLKGAAG